MILGCKNALAPKPYRRSCELRDDCYVKILNASAEHAICLKMVLNSTVLRYQFPATALFWKIFMFARLGCKYSSNALCRSIPLYLATTEASNRRKGSEAWTASSLGLCRVVNIAW